MKLWGAAIAVLLLALAGVVALNWTTFNAATSLSLGFTQVQAPLGLLLLGVVGLVSLLFMGYILLQQAAQMVESRRMSKELNGQRELADQAEASRFTELRGFIDTELRRLEAQTEAGRRETDERLAQLQQQLQDKLGEATRTLSAYVGEVDDKLDRLHPPLPRP
ncbi:MAG TPA: LapA family protein [Rubrivivax sp.]|nr:LapA family protein [Rubrivivax sp.]